MMLGQSGRVRSLRARVEIVSILPIGAFTNPADSRKNVFIAGLCCQCSLVIKSTSTRLHCGDEIRAFGPLCEPCLFS